MRKTNEEKGLLAKLASGILDGAVGDEQVYRGYKNVYCGKYIKDGEHYKYKCLGFHRKLQRGHKHSSDRHELATQYKCILARR